MNWRHFRFEKWRFQLGKKARKKVCMIRVVWTRKIVIAEQKKSYYRIRNCKSNVDLLEKMAKIQDFDARGVWRP